MNNILCPIDFSSISLNALEFAMNIGKKHHSTITLLNVFTPKDFNEILETDTVQDKYDELLQLAEDKLQAISEELKKKKGLSECVYKLKSCKFIDGLKQCVDEEKTDLIVVGTKGHTNTKAKYVGSNASKIIEYIRKPVLCVPEGHHYHGIKRIVYATDYQEEDKVAIQWLIAMADVLKAHVEILHVSHHDNQIDKVVYNEYKEEMKNFIQYENISFDRLVFRNVSEGIDNYMKSSSGDLLVLLDKKKSFLQSIIGQGLIKNIHHFSEYPLLVIKL